MTLREFLLLAHPGSRLVVRRVVEPCLDEVLVTLEAADGTQNTVAFYAGDVLRNLDNESLGLSLMEGLLRRREPDPDALEMHGRLYPQGDEAPR